MELSACKELAAYLAPRLVKRADNVSLLAYTAIEAKRNTVQEKLDLASSRYYIWITEILDGYTGVESEDAKSA